MIDAPHKVAIESEYTDRTLRRQIGEMNLSHAVIAGYLIASAFISTLAIVAVDAIGIRVDINIQLFKSYGLAR